jgi:hypothetical protein
MIGVFYRAGYPYNDIHAANSPWAEGISSTFSLIVFYTVKKAVKLLDVPSRNTSLT